LGTRLNVNRYIQQFTEIFTEEGRKSVKITHQVQNQPPRVMYTQSMREKERLREKEAAALQLQQQQQQQTQQQQAIEAAAPAAEVEASAPTVVPVVVI
jgi:transcription factor SPT20 homolog